MRADRCSFNAAGAIGLTVILAAAVIKGYDWGWDSCSRLPDNLLELLSSLTRKFVPAVWLLPDHGISMVRTRRCAGFQGANPVGCGVCGLTRYNALFSESMPGPLLR